MSSKPTTVPTWATDVGADITDPGASQRGDGWDINDRMPAGWQNWLQNLVGQWCQYLNDQDLTGLLATDDLDVSGAAFITNLTCGTFKHGSMIQQVGAPMMESGSTGTNWERSESSNCMKWFQDDTTSDSLTCILPLRTGDRVLGVKVFWEVGAATADLIKARLLERDLIAGGAMTPKSDDVGNPASTGGQGTTLTNVTATTVATGKVLVVRFTTPGASATGKSVYAVEVTYDRP